MKYVETPKIVEISDKAHELQRARRDLLSRVKDIEDELEPLRASLLRATGGQDFQFPSAEGFIKVVEFNEDEDGPDVDTMIKILLKMRRKIPIKLVINTVVRYLTDDETAGEP